MQSKTKAKGKIEYLGENDLKAHIKSGVFAPCYVLFGDEHYMIKNYTEKIISAAVDGFEDFNITRFDGNVKIQDVYDAVQSFPMMSSRKAVVLCDYPFDKASASETEKLVKMLTEMPSTTVFIMWYETVEINGKKPGEKYSRLFSAVREAGGETAFIGRKSEGELIKLLQSGAARRKCRMEANTARYMIEMCSDDLGTLVNELEKLCLYVGEEGIITNGTVDKVCSRSVEASVYNVSKAVLRGDLSGAYKLLDDLFFMNTDAAYILTLLSSAYTDIYRAFAARSAGLRPEMTAKELGYGNTAFRLAEAERNLRRFSEKQIVEALGILQESDREIKESLVDGRLVLEKTLVRLMTVNRVS